MLTVSPSSSPSQRTATNKYSEQICCFSPDIGVQFPYQHHTPLAQENRLGHIYCTVIGGTMLCIHQQI